jgi:Tfp pilus assembly protein PilN
MHINLLPPDIRERQRARRWTLAVVVIGFIVLAALGGFYFLQQVRLRDVQEDLEAQRAVNADLQQRIVRLQNVRQLQIEADRARDLLAELLQGRVLWSSVLRDISLVIPGETWLSGLTAAVGGEEVAEDAEAAPVAAGLIGQITFSGFAFEHPDVALWLSRLEDVKGFVNPWLSSATKTVVGTTEVVQFNNTVDLSEQAAAGSRGVTP